MIAAPTVPFSLDPASWARDLAASLAGDAASFPHTLRVNERDPAALGPWWIEMATAWGRLARLGPISRMSETPPRWDLPPAPLGTHAPSWA